MTVRVTALPFHEYHDFNATLALSEASPDDCSIPMVANIEPAESFCVIHAAGTKRCYVVEADFLAELTDDIPDATFHQLALIIRNSPIRPAQQRVPCWSL